LPGEFFPAFLGEFAEVSSSDSRGQGKTHIVLKKMEIAAKDCA
jgi:hypothetical protein